MKVCKFGGSSLADAGQLGKVLDIVLADSERRVVVVSAPGKRDGKDTKVTDLLIALAEGAWNGENVASKLGAVVERYASIARELKLGEVVVDAIRRDLEGRLAKRSELDAREFLDLMKAAGEDNNAKLVAVAFTARGKKAVYADPKTTGMTLRGEFGNAELDPKSYPALAKSLKGMDGIIVYPGFFGYTDEGKVATFPRGGSDITGSILAAALEADVYENFTDVDSVYPADPRIVPEVKDGQGIPVMTYREMRELAYAGFGVFNDDAVVPAVKAKIPINIRNTNHPEAPGTMIVQSREAKPGSIVGVASAGGFVGIVIDKYMMNHEIGFGRRILTILEEENIPYEHMPSGIDSQVVIVREKFMSREVEERVLERIREELKPDSVAVNRDLDLLMLVGEGMSQATGMFAKSAQALAAAEVNVLMLNQGASMVSFMLAIKSPDRAKAVRAIYGAFFG